MIYGHNVNLQLLSTTVVNEALSLTQTQMNFVYFFLRAQAVRIPNYESDWFQQWVEFFNLTLNPGQFCFFWPCFLVEENKNVIQTIV